MEASEMPYVPFEPEQPGSEHPTRGKPRMVEIPPRDDAEHAKGFLRLHLMVNSVLERLTRA